MNVDNKYVNGLIRKQIKENLKKVKKKKIQRSYYIRLCYLRAGFFLRKYFVTLNVNSTFLWFLHEFLVNILMFYNRFVSSLLTITC